MSKRSDWDIEALRQEWESDEHWEIRRSFMVAYKDKFPEDKVVCLAQVYANVELLGCRYPDPVMKNINELAKGLDTHRTPKAAEGVKFVRSSEDRSSGGYTGSEPPSKKSKLPNAVQVPKYRRAGFGYAASSLSPSSSLPKENKTAASLFSHEKPAAANTKVTERPPVINKCTDSISPAEQKDERTKLNSSDVHHTQEKVIDQLHKCIKDCEPKSNGGIHLMDMAATRCGVKISWLYNSPPVPKKQPPIFVCELIADNILIGVGTEKNKKTARSLACEAALSMFKKPRTELTVIATESGAYQLITGRAPIFFDEEPRNNDQVGSNPHEPSCKTTAPCYKNVVVPSSLIVVIETYDSDAYANDVETLTRSAAFNKIPLDFDCQEDVNSLYRCDVKMNGRVIASATNYPKQLVKQEAAAAALKYLKTISYIVKIKRRFVAEGEISRESVAIGLKEEETAISEENIGNKLLRMMGWAGGGLGKDGDGIAEPVKASTVYGREGLGLSSQQGITKNFIQQVTTVIREYASSTSNTDLAFSSDFTSDERKEMHMIAKRFNLKSVSRGKGDNRFLVLSRKFGPQQLVQHILERGGSTDKYELIPPPFAQ